MIVVAPDHDSLLLPLSSFRWVWQAGRPKNRYSLFHCTKPEAFQELVVLRHVGLLRTVWDRSPHCFDYYHRIVQPVHFDEQFLQTGPHDLALREIFVILHTNYALLWSSNCHISNIMIICCCNRAKLEVCQRRPGKLRFSLVVPRIKRSARRTCSFNY